MTEILPSGYTQTLALIVERAHKARFAVQRAANTEVIALWWYIGHALIERQKVEPWGSGVLARLAADLRAQFPSVKGFSESNLRYARRLAEAWPSEDAIRQQPVGESPWSHTIQLLDKLDDQSLRDWYAAQDASNGWSRAVLQHQIATRLHERVGSILNPQARRCLDLPAGDLDPGTDLSIYDCNGLWPQQWRVPV